VVRDTQRCNREGRATARNRIVGDGEFIAGESVLLPGERIEVPLVAPERSADRGYLLKKHVLRPGQSALLRRSAGPT
jgi:hypothetical protein